MNRSNLSYREKELAVSSLLRRDREDPGAAELLARLMFDGNYAIRKRAVSISDRFAGHERTLEALLQVASHSDERLTIRERSLEKLEVVFDPHRTPSPQSDLSTGSLYSLKRGVLRLVRNVEEPLSVRGKALELSAYFLSEEVLREWILFFHNKRGTSSRLSAIAAMGRSDDRRWRTYIRGYIDSENMEFTCAALEAMADQDYAVEEMIERDDPSSANPTRYSGESTAGN